MSERTESSKHGDIEMQEKSPSNGDLSASIRVCAADMVSKEERHRAKISALREKGRRVYSAGYWLRKVPFYITYPAIAFFCGAVVVSFFGFVPLNDPDVVSVRKNAIFGFFVLPFVFTISAYLNASIFYAALQIEQPFRNTLWVIWPVYVIEALIFGVATAKKGCFNLIGGAALITCFCVLWPTVLLSIRWVRIHQLHKLSERFYPAFLQYLKVTTTVFIWTLLLIGYIFAFRYGARTAFVQRILPVMRAIFLFAFRKTTLHLCDSFPIDIAMLISGFWCEHLADLFSVVSYPTVKKVSTFYAIWAANFTALLANLAFLTKPWFRFRLWIKNWLKAVFTCNFPIPPPPEADERDNEETADDRGHDRNRQGYLRRQVRFLLWKVAGQACAEFLYLTLTPLLRVGTNSPWFIWSEPDSESYRHSMIFSAANCGFIVLAGIVVVVTVRWFLPRVARQIWKEAKNNIIDLYYVCFVIAIVCANAFICFSIVMRHMKIWYAFIEPGESTINH